jgi:hypothetical protein
MTMRAWVCGGIWMTTLFAPPSLGQGDPRGAGREAGKSSPSSHVAGAPPVSSEPDGILHSLPVMLTLGGSTSWDRQWRSACGSSPGEC